MAEGNLALGLLDLGPKLLREALTGKRGATGYDLTGMQNRPGFGGEDVGAFLTEMLADPGLMVGAPLGMVMGRGIAKMGAKSAAKQAAESALRKQLTEVAERKAAGGVLGDSIKDRLVRGDWFAPIMEGTRVGPETANRHLFSDAGEAASRNYDYENWAHLTENTPRVGMRPWAPVEPHSIVADPDKVFDIQGRVGIQSGPGARIMRDIEQPVRDFWNKKPFTTEAGKKTGETVRQALDFKTDQAKYKNSNVFNVPGKGRFQANQNKKTGEILIHKIEDDGYPEKVEYFRRAGEGYEPATPTVPQEQIDKAWNAIPAAERLKLLRGKKDAKRAFAEGFYGDQKLYRWVPDKKSKYGGNVWVKHEGKENWEKVFGFSPKEIPWKQRTIDEFEMEFGGMPTPHNAFEAAKQFEMEGRRSPMGPGAPGGKQVVVMHPSVAGPLRWVDSFETPAGRFAVLTDTQGRRHRIPQNELVPSLTALDVPPSSAQPVRPEPGRIPAEPGAETSAITAAADPQAIGGGRVIPKYPSNRFAAELQGWNPRYGNQFNYQVPTRQLDVNPEGVTNAPYEVPGVNNQDVSALDLLRTLENQRNRQMFKLPNMKRAEPRNVNIIEDTQEKLVDSLKNKLNMFTDKQGVIQTRGSSGRPRNWEKTLTSDTGIPYLRKVMEQMEDRGVIHAPVRPEPLIPSKNKAPDAPGFTVEEKMAMPDLVDRLQQMPVTGFPSNETRRELSDLRKQLGAPEVPYTIPENVEDLVQRIEPEAAPGTSDLGKALREAGIETGYGTQGREVAEGVMGRVVRDARKLKRKLGKMAFTPERVKVKPKPKKSGKIEYILEDTAGQAVAIPIERAKAVELAAKIEKADKLIETLARRYGVSNSEVRYMLTQEFGESKEIANILQGVTSKGRPRKGLKKGLKRLRAEYEDEIASRQARLDSGDPGQMVYTNRYKQVPTQAGFLTKNTPMMKDAKGEIFQSLIEPTGPTETRQIAKMIPGADTPESFIRRFKDALEKAAPKAVGGDFWELSPAQQRRLLQGKAGRDFRRSLEYFRDAPLTGDQIAEVKKMADAMGLPFEHAGTPAEVPSSGITGNTLGLIREYIDAEGKRLAQNRKTRRAMSEVGTSETFNRLEDAGFQAALTRSPRGKEMATLMRGSQAIPKRLITKTSSAIADELRKSGLRVNTSVLSQKLQELTPETFDQAVKELMQYFKGNGPKTPLVAMLLGGAAGAGAGQTASALSQSLRGEG